jgi:hypothetical protein
MEEEKGRGWGREGVEQTSRKMLGAVGGFLCLKKRGEVKTGNSKTKFPASSKRYDLRRCCVYFSSFRGCPFL